MKNWLGSVFGWLKARKMVLVAVFWVVPVIVLVAYGKITPEGGLAGLLCGAAIFWAGLHDALERHRAEVLPILVGTAAVLRDVAAKNVKAAEKDGLAVAIQGEHLAVEIHAEKGQPQQ